MTTNQAPPSGVLIINKPSGWTSHDVVNKVRRIFNTRKVGHAGTLDPLATGVLVILIGRATKASDHLLAQDKTYLATISFGQQTDTGDAEGTVINTADASQLTETGIAKVLPTMLGEQDQMVPAYSAVKVNGQKLYNLARAGKVAQDRPVRRITIHSIELQQFSASPPFPSAQIKIICSKGTYIRVLAESIAEKLDSVGHLIALERQASGQYTLDHAVTLETLQAAANPTIYLIDPPAKEL